MSNTELVVPAPATPPRVQGRDKERTRREILAAAERVIMRRGASVSLAEMATEAGVTKSGLMHHFKTRDDLLSALVIEINDKFWEEVRNRVDLSENRPGKFLRAYVRVLTERSSLSTHIFGGTGIIARLGSEKGIEFISAHDAEDAKRWDAAFDADGIPEARSLVVRLAAEGAAFSVDTPYMSDAQRMIVRDELLAMCEL